MTRLATAAVLACVLLASCTKSRGSSAGSPQPSGSPSAGANAGGPESPDKPAARSTSFQEFLGDRGLAKAEGEAFSSAVNKDRGLKVCWEMRAFNVEMTTTGYETPDEKQSRYTECAIFMLPTLPAGVSATDIPAEQFILVRCLKGVGAGVEAVEPGKTYKVEGSVWGALAGGWREVYLKEFSIRPSE